MALKHSIIFIIFVGFTWAQTEYSIGDALSSLPPDLQGKIDEKQVTELKSKATEAFKQKCEQNGGPDAYASSEKAFTGFYDCIKELVNPADVQKEVEAAKPTGQVDEVFKKYCNKKQLFKDCFHNLTETVKPCFSVEEQKNLKTVYNITDQMAEFVCFKDGDRIALFIAEDGPECLQSKREEIEVCLNNTIGSDFHYGTNKMSIENIPKISFGDEECDKFGKLQICVVTALETCEAPATANIVESLFKFARKSTPCKELPEEGEGNARSQKDVTATQQPSSANALMKSLAVGASALALISLI